MPVVNPRVPEGLRDLMKGLTKEVLREKPPNIYEFSAHYFETLLQENKDFIVKEYEPVISYENLFQAKERNQIPVALVFKIIPEGLTELIKEFIKAVLRENPKNLCEFAVEYFRHIKKVGNIKDGRIQYTAYENYFSNNERFVFTPYVKCTCGRTFGEGLAQVKEINKNHFAKKDKAKPPMQKSLAKISAVSAIKLDNSTKSESDHTAEESKPSPVVTLKTESIEITTKIYDESYVTAIYVIQRFFKRCLRKQKTLKTSTTTQNGVETSSSSQMSEEAAAIIIQRSLRKLFTQKFHKDEKSYTSLVPHLENIQQLDDHNDNVSEAASYTSASTVQMSAESAGEATEREILEMGGGTIVSEEQAVIIHRIEEDGEQQNDSAAAKPNKVTSAKMANSLEGKVVDIIATPLIMGQIETKIVNSNKTEESPIYDNGQMEHNTPHIKRDSLQLNQELTQENNKENLKISHEVENKETNDKKTTNSDENHAEFDEKKDTENANLNLKSKSIEENDDTQNFETNVIKANILTNVEKPDNEKIDASLNGIEADKDESERKLDAEDEAQLNEVPKEVLESVGIKTSPLLSESLEENKTQETKKSEENITEENFSEKDIDDDINAIEEATETKEKNLKESPTKLETLDTFIDDGKTESDSFEEATNQKSQENIHNAVKMNLLAQSEEENDGNKIEIETSSADMKTSKDELKDIKIANKSIENISTEDSKESEVKQLEESNIAVVNDTILDEASNKQNSELKKESKHADNESIEALASLIKDRFFNDNIINSERAQEQTAEETNNDNSEIDENVPAVEEEHIRIDCKQKAEVLLAADEIDKIASKNEAQNIETSVESPSVSVNTSNNEQIIKNTELQLEAQNLHSEFPANSAANTDQIETQQHDKNITTLTEDMKEVLENVVLKTSPLLSESLEENKTYETKKSEENITEENFSEKDKVDDINAIEEATVIKDKETLGSSDIAKKESTKHAEQHIIEERNSITDEAKISEKNELRKLEVLEKKIKDKEIIGSSDIANKESTIYDEQHMDLNSENPEIVKEILEKQKSITDEAKITEKNALSNLEVLQEKTSAEDTKEYLNKNSTENVKIKTDEEETTNMEENQSLDEKNKQIVDAKLSEQTESQEKTQNVENGLALKSSKDDSSNKESKAANYSETNKKDTIDAEDLKEKLAIDSKTVNVINETQQSTPEPLQNVVEKSNDKKTVNAEAKNSNASEEHNALAQPTTQAVKFETSLMQKPDDKEAECVDDISIGNLLKTDKLEVSTDHLIEDREKEQKENVVEDTIKKSNDMKTVNEKAKNTDATEQHNALAQPVSEGDKHEISLIQKTDYKKTKSIDDSLKNLLENDKLADSADSKEDKKIDISNIKSNSEGDKIRIRRDTEAVVINPTDNFTKEVLRNSEIDVELPEKIRDVSNLSQNTSLELTDKDLVGKSNDNQNLNSAVKEKAVVVVNPSRTTLLELAEESIKEETNNSESPDSAIKNNAVDYGRKIIGNAVDLSQTALSELAEKGVIEESNDIANLDSAFKKNAEDHKDSNEISHADKSTDDITNVVRNIDETVQTANKIKISTTLQTAESNEQIELLEEKVEQKVTENTENITTLDDATSAIAKAIDMNVLKPTDPIEFKQTDQNADAENQSSKTNGSKIVTAPEVNEKEITKTDENGTSLTRKNSIDNMKESEDLTTINESKTENGVEHQKENTQETFAELKSKDSTDLADITETKDKLQEKNDVENTDIIEYDTSTATPNSFDSIGTQNSHESKNGISNDITSESSEQVKVGKSKIIDDSSNIKNTKKTYITTTTTGQQHEPLFAEIHLKSFNRTNLLEKPTLKEILQYQEQPAVKHVEKLQENVFEHAEADTIVPVTKALESNKAESSVAENQNEAAAKPQEKERTATYLYGIHTPRNTPTLGRKNLYKAATTFTIPFDDKKPEEQATLEISNNNNIVADVKDNIESSRQVETEDKPDGALYKKNSIEELKELSALYKVLLENDSNADSEIEAESPTKLFAELNIIEDAKLDATITAEEAALLRNKDIFDKNQQHEMKLNVESKDSTPSTPDGILRTIVEINENEHHVENKITTEVTYKQNMSEPFEPLEFGSNSDNESDLTSSWTCSKETDENVFSDEFLNENTNDDDEHYRRRRSSIITITGDDAIQGGIYEMEPSNNALVHENEQLTKKSLDDTAVSNSLITVKDQKAEIQTSSEKNLSDVDSKKSQTIEAKNLSEEEDQEQKGSVFIDNEGTSNENKQIEGAGSRQQDALHPDSSNGSTKQSQVEAEIIRISSPMKHQPSASSSTNVNNTALRSDNKNYDEAFSDESPKRVMQKHIDSAEAENSSLKKGNNQTFSEEHLDNLTMEKTDQNTNNTKQDLKETKDDRPKTLSASKLDQVAIIKALNATLTNIDATPESSESAGKALIVAKNNATKMVQLEQESAKVPRTEQSIKLHTDDINNNSSAYNGNDHKANTTEDPQKGHEEKLQELTNIERVKINNSNLMKGNVKNEINDNFEQDIIDEVNDINITKLELDKSENIETKINSHFVENQLIKVDSEASEKLIDISPQKIITVENIQNFKDTASPLGTTLTKNTANSVKENLIDLKHRNITQFWEQVNPIPNQIVERSTKYLSNVSDNNSDNNVIDKGPQIDAEDNNLKTINPKSSNLLADDKLLHGTGSTITTSAEIKKSHDLEVHNKKSDDDKNLKEEAVVLNVTFTKDSASPESAEIEHETSTLEKIITPTNYSPMHQSKTNSSKVEKPLDEKNNSKSEKETSQVKEELSKQTKTVTPNLNDLETNSQGKQNFKGTPKTLDATIVKDTLKPESDEVQHETSDLEESIVSTDYSPTSKLNKSLGDKNNSQELITKEQSKISKTVEGRINLETKTQDSKELAKALDATFIKNVLTAENGKVEHEKSASENQSTKLNVNAGISIDEKSNSKTEVESSQDLNAQDMEEKSETVEDQNGSHIKPQDKQIFSVPAKALDATFIKNISTTERANLEHEMSTMEELISAIKNQPAAQSTETTLNTDKSIAEKSHLKAEVKSSQELETKVAEEQSKNTKTTEYSARTDLTKSKDKLDFKETAKPLDATFIKNTTTLVSTEFKKEILEEPINPTHKLPMHKSENRTTKNNISLDKESVSNTSNSDIKKPHNVDSSDQVLKEQPRKTRARENLSSSELLKSDDEDKETLEGTAVALDGTFIKNISTTERANLAHEMSTMEELISAIKNQPVAQSTKTTLKTEKSIAEKNHLKAEEKSAQELETKVAEEHSENTKTAEDFAKINLIMSKDKLDFKETAKPLDATFTKDTTTIESAKFKKEILEEPINPAQKLSMNKSEELTTKKDNCINKESVNNTSNLDMEKPKNVDTNDQVLKEQLKETRAIKSLSSSELLTSEVDGKKTLEGTAEALDGTFTKYISPQNSAEASTLKKSMIPTNNLLTEQSTNEVTKVEKSTSIITKSENVSSKDDDSETKEVTEEKTIIETPNLIDSDGNQNIINDHIPQEKIINTLESLNSEDNLHILLNNVNDNLEKAAKSFDETFVQPKQEDLEFVEKTITELMVDALKLTELEGLIAQAPSPPTTEPTSVELNYTKEYQDDAATTIQKHYKGYRVRKLKKLNETIKPSKFDVEENLVETLDVASTEKTAKAELAEPLNKTTKDSKDDISKVEENLVPKSNSSIDQPTKADDLSVKDERKIVLNKAKAQEAPASKKNTEKDLEETTKFDNAAQIIQRVYRYYKANKMASTKIPHMTHITSAEEIASTTENSLDGSQITVILNENYQSELNALQSETNLEHDIQKKRSIVYIEPTAPPIEHHSVPPHEESTKVNWFVGEEPIVRSSSGSNITDALVMDHSQVDVDNSHNDACNSNNSTVEHEKTSGISFMQAKLVDGTSSLFEPAKQLLTNTISTLSTSDEIVSAAAEHSVAEETVDNSLTALETPDVELETVNRQNQGNIKNAADMPEVQEDTSNIKTGKLKEDTKELEEAAAEHQDKKKDTDVSVDANISEQQKESTNNTQHSEESANKESKVETAELAKSVEEKPSQDLEKPLSAEKVFKIEKSSDFENWHAGKSFENSKEMQKKPETKDLTDSDKANIEQITHFFEAEQAISKFDKAQTDANENPTATTSISADSLEAMKNLTQFINLERKYWESDIPYTKLEEPCTKKSIYLVEPVDEGEVDDAQRAESSLSDIRPTTADFDAETEQSSTDSLESMTKKLHDADLAIERMQQRRASTARSNSNDDGKIAHEQSFDEPVIKSMQELQENRSSELEDEEAAVILQRLQREDTRESSAQSDAVVFGANKSAENQFEYEFEDTPLMKISLQRVHTIAGDDPKSLFKSVTIDDTVQYIEPPECDTTATSGSSFCLDDDDVVSENIRKKMMAYSLSEADSDFFENDGGDVTTRMGGKQKLHKDDFNISTALVDLAGTSTETESTIVSATTKIQAGARGFLTRKRLRRTSGGTKSTLPDNSKASFGNAAISESLERLIEDEAAKKIQNAYRRHYRQKDLKSSTAGEKDATKRQRTNADDEEDAHVLLSFESTLAARRLTLQRGDALRNDSTPDEENGNGNGKALKNMSNESENELKQKAQAVVEQSVDKISATEGSSLESDSMHTHGGSEEITSSASFEEEQIIESQQNNEVPTLMASVEDKKFEDVLDKSSTSALTAADANNKKKIDNELKWISHRQNSMPVQIEESEVFRVIPKHMRKRIKSAEPQKKKHLRVLRD